jgi:hypothetical protein
MSPRGPLDMIISRAWGGARRFFSICSRHASHGSFVGVSRRWMSIFGAEICSGEAMIGEWDADISDHACQDMRSRQDGM